MKKLPKFLVAQNSLAEPGKLFLLHTQKPRFMGEIFQFESLKEFNYWEIKGRDLNTCTIVGAEVCIGIHTKVNDLVIAMYVIEFYDTPESNDDIGRRNCGALMARTGDWLHSYFKSKLQTHDAK